MQNAARFQRIENLELSEVPDGYVVYQSSKDRVHFLNQAAAVIFELCDGNHDASEIRSILVSGYDLSTFPEDDFQTALDSMLAEGLIEQCPMSS
jgi:hypothetical protein